MSCCDGLAAVAKRYAERYTTGGNEMAKVKVRYDVTRAKAEVSVGDLGSFEFEDGSAMIEESVAQELTRQSPHFKIVEEKSNARSDSSVATTDGAGKGNDVGDGGSS